MFFSKKKLNLVCVETTTSFGPGRLHKTQYAWLLTVLCRGKITEGGLFMTPLEFFPTGLWLGVEQTSTHVFSVCLKLSHLLRRFRHRTPPFVYSIRNFL